MDYVLYFLVALIIVALVILARSLYAELDDTRWRLDALCEDVTELRLRLNLAEGRLLRRLGNPWRMSHPAGVIASERVCVANMEPHDSDL